MTVKEYKNMLKGEIKKFICVRKVSSPRTKELTIWKREGAPDKNDFVTYLTEQNRDKYEVLYENDSFIRVEILDLEKYKEPKTELDIEIDELENKLKELKEKRKIEKNKQRMKNQIEELKKQLKELEEN